MEWRPWLDSAGIPAIQGCAGNKRRILSVQRKYAKRIIDEGIDMEQRGLQCGFIDTNNKEHTDLMGGKQLAAAFYLALKAAPNNEHVKAALKQGYKVSIFPQTCRRQCGNTKSPSTTNTMTVRRSRCPRRGL